MAHELDFTELNAKTRVITPSDEAYESLRSVHGFPGQPAVIVQPVDTAGVSAAITFASQNELEVAVRSGGHGYAGHTTNMGGMVIDVRNLNEVILLDVEQSTVRIGSGALWGDVADQLASHGLAISSGDTRSVGVGGLTLGGGMGWMVRQYGLAIDALIGADIVTADGAHHHVDKDVDPELFWAVRGGGGNFGVVTSFDFTALKISDVFSGSIMYEGSDVGRLIKSWRDYMLTAPEQLTTTLMLMASPGRQMVMLGVCWNGSDSSVAEPIIRRLEQLGTIIKNGVTKKPYHESLQDIRQNPTGRIVAFNSLMVTIPDEVIDLIEQKFNNNALFAQIRSIGRAVGRVTPEETAYSHRDAQFMLAMPQSFAPDASEDVITQARAAWQSIAAHGIGTYSNFLTEDDGTIVNSIYSPSTLERLKEIKRQYDPENIFRGNYNILPN
jgi:FAD/FMN-containing dehydrogenase